MIKTDRQLNESLSRIVDLLEDIKVIQNTKEGIELSMNIRLCNIFSVKWSSPF